ncbi:hypothetical protein [Parachitinimonas caeni]|uniref:Uncharacterized protein n=1 Tax=Parachitinimonas caeni TaxID=3031301 RepID=A0ABT7DV55_9NEIS|nr:hypothetical protein [Parachitinimonas caeni]MDK2123869.1 hypothetical protein [Parachitinimonas caeni]
MALYRLRFFFDAGSGICLWSGNAEAHREYGYPIDVDLLPLSATLRRRARELIAWYDSCYDWASLAGVVAWDGAETRRFGVYAQVVLGELRRELGSVYELVDESGTAALV